MFGDRTDVVPLSGVYRYLRIYGKQRSVGNLWGYSIWETSAKGSRYHIADFDDDGVFDDIDQCLETPAGASVDSNGCEIISSDRVTMMELPMILITVRVHLLTLLLIPMDVQS